MLFIINFAIVLVLAWQLVGKAHLLHGLIGMPRFCAALAIALFINAWCGFLTYVLCGWSHWYLPLNFILLAGISKAVSKYSSGVEFDPRSKWWAEAPSVWFIALTSIVLVRFATGVYRDESGGVWASYNFVDTAFHLSIARAFLSAEGFPPMSLNVADYPLKYHFIADFYLAYLNKCGLPLLVALRTMNIISAICMMGSAWAIFEACFRLSARWIALGITFFFFLNPAVTNIFHYLLFRPDYFNPQSIFEGLLIFPYFNFESSLTNLFEPQRGLVFSFPIILLVLKSLFDRALDADLQKTQLLHSLCLICLLPFSHVVGFAVLGACIAPSIVRHHAEFRRQWITVLGFVLLAALQIWYIFAFGPPLFKGFGAWNVAEVLPLYEYRAVLPPLRRLLFWFFANGDFLGWGLLFAAIALYKMRRSQCSDRDVSILVNWRWFYVVTIGAFIGINVYRYSPAWGDSNKFILFFNFGICLLVVSGLHSLYHSPARRLAQAACVFLTALCVGPYCYEIYHDNFVRVGGKVLLFHPNGIAAASWLKTHAQKGAIVLTEACGDFNVVTSVAGLPTLAGIYADSNPYRQPERETDIPNIYEKGQVDLLAKLRVRYVLISRNERNRYHLHPLWRKLAEDSRAVAFRSGEIGALETVVIFDANSILSSTVSDHGPAVVESAF